MTRVVVIGSGVAGTAAALTAASGGASVTLVAGPPGASTLASAALDDDPWEETDAEVARPLSTDARAALDALDGYAVREARARLTVTTGVVRHARGVDRALLDLTPLAGTTVLVAGVLGVARWDARALARAWSASAWARATGTRFVPITTHLLSRDEEHRFTDAELAARHDDPSRLAWVAERLREAMRARDAVPGAILVPPWLGAERERATELSQQLGLPCGEATGGVAGASGLRFEGARERALARAGVSVVVGRAERVLHEAGGEPPWRVELAAGASSLGPLRADAAVLATGGLIGGGLAYTPAGAYAANALPEVPRALLVATCEAPVKLGAFGRDLDDPSSLFGGSPETHAWPYDEASLLEHAGVLVDLATGQAHGAPPGLYAAGDLSATRRRTWLEALTAGARAGRAAASASASER